MKREVLGMVAMASIFLCLSAPIPAQEQEEVSRPEIPRDEVIEELRRELKEEQKKIEAELREVYDWVREVLAHPDETPFNINDPAMKEALTEGIEEYRESVQRMIDRYLDVGAIYRQYADGVRTGAEAIAPTPRVSKIVKVNNAHTARNILETFDGVDMTMMDDRANLVGISGPEERVEEAIATLKEFDVAPVPQNVELTVYMLEAKLDGPESDYPTGLDDVVAELKKVFQYQQYRLIDTLILRARDREGASVSGMLPTELKRDVQDEFGMSTYNLSVDSVRVEESTDWRTIRIDDFVFGAEFPLVQRISGNQEGFQARARVQRRSVGIQTNVDIREGQTAVVGKANVDGTSDALFIVVTAKIMAG